jgi:lipopolysaccharide/colanic/teichoic acid biosynthesis glycosyltransferase
MNHTVYSIHHKLTYFDKRRDVNGPGTLHKTLTLEAKRIGASNGVQASRWSVSRAKRFLDVIASLTAIALLSPFMFVLAMMVGLSTKGPIIFAQKRVGSHGKLFTIFKFRTMEVGSTQQGGPAITVHGDPRVTRLGAFLRRYKLDELPQLFNLLRGEMSLVGPRPKLPHHEAMGMPFRPGLTGAATLAFHREEEMLRLIPAHDLDGFYDRTVKPLKARLDWEYMGSATLASDLVLMINTAIACVRFRSDRQASTS